MKALFALVLLSAVVGPVFCQERVEDLVHTRTGTQNEGQTYPAVGPPFAMTQWTPQTRAGETKAIAPYYYTDKRIQGIRATHFLSGSAVPDYGTITLMPGMGPLKTEATDRSSSFEHTSELATPYVYRVELPDAHTSASVAGTTRAGILRFAFTQDSDDAWIVLENNARAGEGAVQINAEGDELMAQVPVRREYAGSGKPAGFSAWFVLKFDHKVASFGTYVGKATRDGGKRQEGDGKPVGVVVVPKLMTSTGGATEAAATAPVSSPRPGFGMYLHFGRVRKGETISVRVGSSFVSADGARKNLQAEIPDWDFTRVEDEAHRAWHEELSRIQIAGSDPAKTVFYTAMYHALLQPRVYNDVDGSYPRFHDHGAVEKVKARRAQFDDFSIWDIFRAQAPLLMILEPERESEMLQSIITKGEQGGFLPIFPAWNSYTSEMVGDHAAVMIADAWQKGLRGFDIESAYRLIRKNATQKPTDHSEYLDGKGRRALDSYLKYGYIPLEDGIVDAFHKNEQVSRTLEYAYDDAMISKLAASLGHKEDIADFAKRGENWRNVIDARVGFARGRYADGSWVAPFDPASRPVWITEGTPAVYTFFVPQDVAGLIQYLGGNNKFIAKLDDLFANNLYDHGNEPSHHIAYLYALAGAPEKTQQHVREILDTQYHDGPAGLAGNDDAGQMSAWYIMSALGFYQVAPGIPVYTLGVPRFDEMTVSLPNHKVLHVEARGTERGKFHVTRILLNGTPITNYQLTHQGLMAGGKLEFILTE